MPKAYSKAPPEPRRSYTVLIDTREQEPYAFDDVVTERRGLKTGDYALLEYPDAVVERKSRADYWGCLATGRERFEAELWRLASFNYPLVVLECDWKQLCEPFLFNGGGGVMRRSKVPPLVAQNSLLSWMARYRVPILPCGSRAQAARVVLQHFDMVDRIKKEEKKRTTVVKNLAEVAANAKTNR